MSSEAAVAVIRVAGNPHEYLILRRALNLEDPWSGHFSLPGGRRENQDADLLATCIRETQEECGIALAPEYLVKPLPRSQAGNILGHPAWVTPFLFELPARPDLELDAREIADYHWVSAEYLLNPANQLEAPTLPQDPRRLFPCVRLGDGYLWGFTYRVMRELLDF
jgi:8-oxo-dGTP pyrophosphatase MutT (NUDIX family)